MFNGLSIHVNALDSKKYLFRKLQGDWYLGKKATFDIQYALTDVSL